MSVIQFKVQNNLLSPSEHYRTAQIHLQEIQNESLKNIYDGDQYGTYLARAHASRRQKKVPNVVQMVRKQVRAEAVQIFERVLRNIVFLTAFVAQVVLVSPQGQLKKKSNTPFHSCNRS